MRAYTLGIKNNRGGMSIMKKYLTTINIRTPDVTQTRTFSCGECICAKKYNRPYGCSVKYLRQYGCHMYESVVSALSPVYSDDISRFAVQEDEKNRNDVIDIYVKPDAQARAMGKLDKILGACRQKQR